MDVVDATDLVELDSLAAAFSAFLASFLSSFLDGFLSSLMVVVVVVVDCGLWWRWLICYGRRRLVWSFGYYYLLLSVVSVAWGRILRLREHVSYLCVFMYLQYVLKG